MSSLDKIRAQLRLTESSKSLNKLWSPKPIEFLKSGVFSQGLYFGWASLNLVYQLLELFLLAFVHYIFISPEALNLLRFFPSSSILAAVLSLQLRFFVRRSDFDPQAKKDHLRYTAQKLLQLGLILSLLATVYVLFFTTLHFSAPPIFRAVILAGIIGLCFDGILSFSFFSIPIARKIIVLPKLRMVAIASMLPSLACVYFDLPLLYLLFRVLPKGIATIFVVKAVMGLEWRSLFYHPGFQFVSPLWKKICQHSFLIQASLEFALLVGFSSIASDYQNAAILLFFIHKMYHVSLILQIKFGFRRFRELRILQVLPVMLKTGNWLKNIVLSFLIHSGFALLLLPVLYLKRNLLLWISPTGESIELSWLLWVAMGAYVLLKFISNSWLLSFDFSRLNKNLITACFSYQLGLGLCLFFAGYVLSSFINIEQLFVGMLLVDCLASFLFAIYLYHKFSGSYQSQLKQTFSRNAFFVELFEGEALSFRDQMRLEEFSKKTIKLNQRCLILDLGNSKSNAHELIFEVFKGRLLRMLPLYKMSSQALLDAIHLRKTSNTSKSQSESLVSALDLASRGKEEADSFFSFLRRLAETVSLIECSFWKAKSSNSFVHVLADSDRLRFMEVNKSSHEDVVSKRSAAIETTFKQLARVGDQA